MNTLDLLSHLQSLGVTLRAKEGKLSCVAPQGVLTPALRDEIAGRKAEILQFLELGSEGAIAPPPLVPVAVKEEVPLSYAQLRLWLLEQFTPETTVNNVPALWKIEGPLDHGAFRRSFNEIIRRHESLRMSVAERDGKPVQVVQPSLTIDLPVLDVQGRPEAEQEREIAGMIEAEMLRPFDLSQAPLFRTYLIRQSEDLHSMVFVPHHIIWDGWSFDLFFQEMDVLYRAFIKEEPSPLPDLTINYQDYTLWHRNWMLGGEMDRQLAYWKEHLAGELPLLKMPTDRPRPARMTFRGAQHTLALPLAARERLQALGREEGATLYMVLLAAFYALLHRYTGQDDFIVGTPIQARQQPEAQGVIGLFMNTLPLRARVDPSMSFRDLLRQVRSVCVGAFSHQDVPLERLVAAVKPRRDPSYTPLFQALFSFQDVTNRSDRIGGLVKSIKDKKIKVAETDLIFGIKNAHTHLTASIDYSTDLFDGETIARMLQHFERLLEGLVEDPDVRVGSVSLLTPEERRQQRVGWNAMEGGCPEPACILPWIEEQAARQPEAVAVVFGDERLTYETLNRRANQLAHYLQKRGVGPETLVGIMTERSLELVVGLLGILKAGGAYVPLDPDYPEGRLRFILGDAQVKLLLTQAHLAERLPEHEADVVRLDADWPEIAQAPEHNAESGVTPGHQAYVIYTSGSTGRPKGVLVSHAHIARLIASTESWFHFGPEDVWTMFHSYAFDFSVWELWGALATGGQVVVVPYAVTRSPDDFYTMLADQGVTVLNQTPSAFRQLILAEERVGHRSDLALRLVIFGGEALEFQSLQPWVDRHGDEKPHLVNMYGITETTVHVTAHRLTHNDVENEQRSVIGVPLADLQVYVLDREQQLQPPGLPGGLYVGGAGVSRGYLHQPALTAERFVPHPFSDVPGARLYKTGDLGRYLARGDLEYMGRADQQVKIRGFRIELGEIEAVLRQVPSVDDAVVMAYEDAPAQQRLVAYVVTEQPGAVSALRSHLRQHLPEYMVPSGFEFLDALPLTAHGKVDRKALPAPDLSVRGLDVDYVAPATPLETLIAEIWRGLLGVDRVGVHDTFVDLGGHSLLAVQVVARLEKERGVRVNATTLMFQTLGQFAASYEEELHHSLCLNGSSTSAAKATNPVLDVVARVKRVMLGSNE